MMCTTENEHAADSLRSVRVSRYIVMPAYNTHAYIGITRTPPTAKRPYFLLFFFFLFKLFIFNFSVFYEIIFLFVRVYRAVRLSRSGAFLGRFHMMMRIRFRCHSRFYFNATFGLPLPVCSLNSLQQPHPDLSSRL